MPHVMSKRRVVRERLDTCAKLCKQQEGLLAKICDDYEGHSDTVVDQVLLALNYVQIYESMLISLRGEL